MLHIKHKVAIPDNFEYQDCYKIILEFPSELEIQSISDGNYSRSDESHVQHLNKIRQV